MNATTRSFIEALKADSDIRGIILFGSWARGNNRPDSDVDLLVIRREGFRRVVEVVNEQAFEITYTTEQGALDFWQANPDDAVELWNIAQVLFDRDGVMARLRQAGASIRAQGKAPLDPDQLAHLQFDVFDQIRAVRALSASDPTTAKMILSFKLFQLTELYFDIRQQWTPPPKQRLARIRQQQPALDDLVRRFHEVRSLSEQVDLIEKIARLVFQRSG